MFCFHYPSGENEQAPLLPSFPPLALDYAQLSSSVKWGQEPYSSAVRRINADEQRVGWAPRTALSLSPHSKPTAQVSLFPFYR